jgi:hypothetical protein
VGSAKKKLNILTDAPVLISLVVTFVPQKSLHRMQEEPMPRQEASGKNERCRSMSSNSEREMGLHLPIHNVHMSTMKLLHENRYENVDVRINDIIVAGVRLDGSRA